MVSLAPTQVYPPLRTHGCLTHTQADLVSAKFSGHHCTILLHVDTMLECKQYGVGQSRTDARIAQASLRPIRNEDHFEGELVIVGRKTSTATA